MDFSVIRPKPPPKRPEPPAPKPPAAPEDKPPQPQYEKPLPPHPRPTMAMPPHMGPYMEEFDRISRIQHLRNIEYTNARTWRMNFGHHPNDYYDNTYSNYGSHQNCHPGGSYMDGGYGTRHMFPARPPPLSDHHPHCLTGPPPRLALPPPEYNYFPLGPSYYPAPHYGGGYFSDENPNGCMIM
ncbi:hypothetical protein F511_30451 [Dorcoceras hygrometricum]|uniref:Uncharacterized protein n=1 Tax=Dorcoceras hygrometricum TaxID=472368 RepID=A0A2Z7BZP4_9LAMI|nr:hypothetical protein F511_30451 [Dorcoceras hygrometricum]